MTNSESNNPIKKTISISALILWNTLLLYDFVTGKFPFGICTSIALSLILLVGVLTYISEDFRKLLLKPGKKFKNYKRFSLILIIISSFMLIQLSLMLHYFN